MCKWKYLSEKGFVEVEVQLRIQSGANNWTIVGVINDHLSGNPPPIE